MSPEPAQTERTDGDRRAWRAYLDNNATTAILPAAADAADLAMRTCGNPSSLHAQGRDAARLLSAARASVAAWLHTSQRSVVFTSGGTEALRLAILGALAPHGARPRGRHVVASAIEHSAVGDLLRALAVEGVTTSFVRPGRDGRVAPSSVAEAMTDDTALVAVLAASNETGVIQPTDEIGSHCRARGTAFLVDAVQAAGKIPIDLSRANAPDLVAVSAHKCHGPRGVGALIVKDAALWKPPFPATHEAGRRAGTEPLPAIVGFGVAAEAANAMTDSDRQRMAVLRDRFEGALVGAVSAAVNGTAPRVPNTSNLAFDRVDADRLLAMLDRAGVDASGGSACHAGSPEPSHVLLAMGLSAAHARSSIRFSLSRFTTQDEVDRALGVVIEAVMSLRR